MKYAALFALLLPLGLVSLVNAETNVDISNNGGESKTNVEINTTTGSSNTSTPNSHTKVRIESNGKVTTYESDKPENIDLQSEDGTAKVSIKNGASITSTPTGTVSATEKSQAEIREKLQKAKVEAEKKIVEAKEEQKNILEKIKDFLNQFFEF